MQVQGNQGGQDPLGEERAQIRELQVAVDKIHAALAKQEERAAANAEETLALRTGIDKLLKAHGL